MHRRTFLGGSLAAAGLIATARRSHAAQATPEASPTVGTATSPGADDLGLPLLELALTDSGFVFPEPVVAGRYRVAVSNTGTLSQSHFGLGKVPDTVSNADYEAWIATEEGDTDVLRFEDIAFVGVPDWPPPGGSVSGIVDLDPGRYVMFDPFGARGVRTLHVGGEPLPADLPEPPADLTVTLADMTITIPDEALTSAPRRWKIENLGSMSHDVAVVPVTPDFTDEHLQMLLTMPEDATPAPGTPELVYQPAAAIGILAKTHASWLDVQLAPGRYLAVCMLPFSTGYPHAMDGMYRFLDIE